MLKDPIVGDLVENLRSYRVAKVIEVNNRFGWFKVQYFEDDYIKEHTLMNEGSTVFRRLTSQEKADFFWLLEKHGITDNWRE